MNPEIESLKQELSLLSARMNRMEKSDRYVFEKRIQMADGMKIQTGTTNGLIIGAATTQKVGFFAKTPVAQQAAVTRPSGGSTVDTESRSAINTIITQIQNLGFWVAN